MRRHDDHVSCPQSMRLAGNGDLRLTVHDLD
jgi:hypothetical protein